MRIIELHSHIFLCPNGQFWWRICRFTKYAIFQRFGILVSNQLHIETVVKRWKALGENLLFSIRNYLVSRLNSSCIRLDIIHKSHRGLFAYVVSWHSRLAHGSSISGALIGYLFRNTNLIPSTSIKIFTFNDNSRPQPVLLAKSFVGRRSQGRSQWPSFRCSKALVIWVDAIIIYLSFF